MRALKLWFVIRDQGVSGLQARIRRDLEHAQWLAVEISRTAHWKVLTPVRLQTLVVRHEPPGFDATAIDTHTRAWAQAINESGEAFLTPAVIADRWAVRVSIGAAATSREHVADLWRLMRETAQAIQAKQIQAKQIQEGARR
jgi:aromatic-L-amino-acid decarboxylase